jgi:hypothetical protein
MKLLIEILMVIAIIAFLAALVFPALAQRDKNKSHYSKRFCVRPLSFFERMALPFVCAMENLSVRANKIGHGGNRIVLANYVAQRAGCRDSKLADEAIGRRTLVKYGSDSDHIGVCDAADIPLGATEDNSASAAEDRVSFSQFGLTKEELEGVASGAIADGDLLVPAANGLLRTLPAGAGTYYICGRAKGAAADGEPVVFIPCFPIQRVVA